MDNPLIRTTLVVFSLLYIFSSGDCRVNYNGYRILRVNATSDRVYNALDSLVKHYPFVMDFLSLPSKKTPTDVLLSPGRLFDFTLILKRLGTPYEILTENVEREIQYERDHYLAPPGLRGRDMHWNSYQRLETIHSWMDTMAEQHPDYVSVMTVGKSHEGRPLKVMKISSGPVKADKPAIWIDGGIHAREWISPATVTYIANELITQATTANNESRSLVDTFDWYVDPVMNPDGYEYTQYDRLWRKTRSGALPLPAGFLGCKGTDPNRNWDFNWAGKGTSKNQCSQVYHGPSAASEPEVKSIQDFVMERKDQIKLFLTFHSYSQLLLLPWGYDEIRTEDHDDLTKVGDKALSSLKAVHGTEYTAGPTAEILYAAAGGSHDWAKGVAGIKFAYCYELRDTGTWGFILPADQIIPSGEETFAAVQSMAEDMMEYYKL